MAATPDKSLHVELTRSILDLTFEGLLISDAYKIDLLVDDLVVVETKPWSA
jgi:hypothetical protein